MEFVYSNFYNTTTMIAVNSNTGTSGFLFNPDRQIQYISSGLNNDLTAASIRINFASTLTVNRIALVNFNAKSFTVFYNGATANTFSLTGPAATTTSDFSTNSETSIFIKTNSVACTSVSIDLKSTMVANVEKAIGWLVVSSIQLDFERDPSAKDYTPKLDPKRIVHTLSDGGTRIHWVKDKHSADVSFKHISTTFRNNLRTVYDTKSEFIFAPFGTTTSWDGIIFPCVWNGAFDFYKYSDDNINAGFSGKISLRET